MTSISQTYSSLDEDISINKNLKICNCQVCCRVFMPPPNYKGLKPKFCNKCNKKSNLINLRSTENNYSYKREESINEMTEPTNSINILDKNLSNKDSSIDYNCNKGINIDLISLKLIFKLIISKQLIIYNLLLEKTFGYLWYLIKLILFLIPLKYQKSQVFQYFKKVQNSQDKLLKQNNISIKTKSRRRKERRQILRKIYLNSFEKHQKENIDLKQTILKQSKYNQVQREILCDEVTNLRKDKLQSSILYNKINKRLIVTNELYLNEKSKNDRISCQLSIDDLKNLVSDEKNNSQNIVSNNNLAEKDDTCNICLSNSKKIAFNCGHKCCCYGCSLRILENQDQKCPICRVKITNIFKIY